MCLSRESNFNSHELLFVQIVEEHIHNVGRLSSTGGPNKKRLNLVLDEMLLQEAISNCIDSSDNDVLDLSVLREVIELLFVD